MYEENRMYPQQNATEAVKQPQVHESIHALESVIEQHLKTHSEVEQRLAPVLRNEPHDASKAPQEPSSAVPIAGRLNESVLRLNSLLDSYRSIIRRLEV